GAGNWCSTPSWTAWRGALPPADRNRPEVAGPRWYFHRAARLIPNEGHVVGQIAADSRRPGARRSISRRWDVVTYEGPGYCAEGTAMRQIRMTKRRRPDDWRLEPGPLDPRDPDIVRAKELDRRTRTATLRPGRVERPGRRAGGGGPAGVRGFRGGRGFPGGVAPASAPCRGRWCPGGPPWRRPCGPAGCADLRPP